MYYLAKVHRGTRPAPERLPATLYKKFKSAIERITLHCTYLSGAFQITVHRNGNNWESEDPIYKILSLKEISREQYLKELTMATTTPVYDQNRIKECSACGRSLLGLSLTYAKKAEPKRAYCSRICRGDVVPLPPRPEALAAAPSAAEPTARVSKAKPAAPRAAAPIGDAPAARNTAAKSSLAGTKLYKIHCNGSRPDSARTVFYHTIVDGVTAFESVSAENLPHLMKLIGDGKVDARRGS